MAYLVVSSTKQTQTVSIRTDGYAYFSTPGFKEWAIDDLKAAVPLQARKWDKASKTWSVKVEYLDALTEMADAFGPVEVIDERESEAK